MYMYMYVCARTLGGQSQSWGHHQSSLYMFDVHVYVSLLHIQELQMRYRSALDNKEEDMRRLQQQVTQLQAASAQSSTLDLLETKVYGL